MAVNIVIILDLKNSGSLSMLYAIRQCVHVAQQPPLKKRVDLETSEDVEIEEEISVEDDKTIDYQNFFYMATLGGAEGNALYQCAHLHNSYQSFSLSLYNYIYLYIYVCVCLLQLICIIR